MSLTLIEQSLDLEEIEDNLYRSKSTWRPLGGRAVFGGQVVAQALVAASKTVSQEFSIHSLHSYFILPGDSSIPIVYYVERVRDGRSFCTRTVKATQRGRSIFTCQASFHKREEFFLQHQDKMPDAPDPTTLPNEKEIYEELSTDSRFKVTDREWFEKLKNQPFPIDIRPCLRGDPFYPQKITPAKQLTWMKANGKLGDDPRFHQCVAAYASDHRLLSTPLLPHGLTFRSPRVSIMTSLDHSMWFYEPFRADEWMLYELESPKFSENRGLSFGRIFTKDGKLAVAVAQEGLIRVQPKL